jgi:phosphopantetheine--protein transferase-like protein
VGLRLPDLPEDHPDALTAEKILTGDADPHWIHYRLHPEEVAYGVSEKAGQSESNRRSFMVGRLALRQALGMEVAGDKSILKDSFGRPQVPAGFLGSISHKGNAGVALVRKTDTTTFQRDCINENPVLSEEGLSPATMGIGIDIEEAKPKRRSIARKVLTPNERRELGRLPNVSAEEEVLLRFSLKESIYKAMHPLICHYVGFQEAEIRPLPDGTADVTLQLKSGAHERFGEITAHWRRIDGFFLSSSSVRLKEGEASEEGSCELPSSGTRLSHRQ